jgi:hypothetical protein
VPRCFGALSALSALQRERERTASSVQAIIVGSDIPDVSRAVICTAAAALDRHEVRPPATQLWSV